MGKSKEASRVAVIDIGTHSLKLLIAEEAGSDIKILESLKNLAPLGKDAFLKGRISQETINRIVSLLEKYAEKIKEYSVSHVRVIATTAVREAENKDVFIDTIFRRTAFKIEVLTVGDVVYYIDAYLYHKLKDRYPIHEKNLLIAELGAGSLDISEMSQGYTLMSMGLPLGLLKIKQLLGRLDASVVENLEAVSEHVENEFACIKRNVALEAIDDIILIDETYAACLPAILSGKEAGGNFFQVSQEDVAKLLEKFSDQSAEDLVRDHKIPSETAETFQGYAVLLNTFVNLNQKKKIYIFEATLSEAILASEVLGYEISVKYNKTNQLISLAASLCKKYDVDLNHVQYVAGLSETLFGSFKETLGLKKSDLLYLLLAAHLHDIGMFIHNRAHHKHAEYIISNLNLFRLTPDEIKIIACIARYHRKGVPAETHLLYQSLPGESQILVQKLSAILRIANAFDRSHKQKVKKLDVKFSRSQDITLVAHVDGNFMLEKMDFFDKKEPLEEISGHKLNLKIQTP